MVEEVVTSLPATKDEQVGSMANPPAEKKDPFEKLMDGKRGGAPLTHFAKEARAGKAVEPSDVSPHIKMFAKRHLQKVGSSASAPFSSEETANMPAGQAHRKMVSLPTIPAPGRGSTANLSQKVIASAPDITRMDFVIAGPGIGSTRTLSTATTEDGRRGSSQVVGPSGLHHSQGPSNPGSRRSTLVFQGKNAMVNSVSRRMSSTVDPAQLPGMIAARSGTPRSSITSSHIQSRQSVAARSDVSASALPSGTPTLERPTILMYPRKEVLMQSNTSLQQVGGSPSRVGSVTSVNRTGSSARVGSHGNLKGMAAFRNPSTNVRSGLSVSASTGALAQPSSTRSSVAQREGEDKVIGSPRIATRYASTGYVPTTVGSAPASSVPIAGGSKRSSLRPPSELDIPEDLRELSAKSSLEDEEIMEGRKPVRTATAHESVGGAFDSRPMSVVGEMEDSYRNNPDYYEYLMLCQRHASSNFIHKIDSSEVVWRNEATPIKMIGRYLLGDQVGKGAFGKVKEGLCSETLQRVAVKIINKKRVRKMQGGLESVVREIKLLRRLKHVNAITLIDVYCKVEDEDSNVGVFNWFSTIEEEPITWKFEDGTEEDRPVDILKWYLIFEYCPCSLQTLLEQSEGHKLPPSRASWFFTQLIEGLAYLHSQGLIHRDIKPGNMLITPDNMLKISDFGIAEQFNGYDGAPMTISSFAGTHQFLSPEIAEGTAPVAGEPADVWACSITLYNMLSGRYPFEFDEDGNLLILYEKIMAATFDMPADFPPEAQDLIYGMLRKDPKERLTTNEILSHPWTRTCFTEAMKRPPPVLAYPITASEAGTPTPTELPSASPLGKSVTSTTRSTTTTSNIKSDNGTRKPAITQVTPCETTLIPFLEELFADEIEDELQKFGKMDEVFGDTFHETGESSSGGTPGKRKLKSWLKNMFSTKHGGSTNSIASVKSGKSTKKL
ncbi:kinase-like domain-containing protein [Phlyctochytrium arcticum]|nr:kinase-like domain-containing protein [Phlyctochytrium arcticum]